MKTTSAQSIVCCLIALLLYSSFCKAQQTSEPLFYKQRLHYYEVFDKQGHEYKYDIGFEQGWILNPVYHAQLSGKYRLDGKKLDIPNTTYFYAVQPGKKIFEGIQGTFDQANSYLFYFKTIATGNTFIFSITHDKFQTTPTENGMPVYRYEDGGTEFTFMYSNGLNVLRKLSIFPSMDLAYNEIILNVNYQAGFFICNNHLAVNMLDDQGRKLTGTSTKKHLGSGEGIIAATVVEVGHRIYRCFSITAGFKVLAEGVHVVADVAVDGKSGSKLTSDNAMLSLVPILNLRFDLAKIK